MKHLMPFGGSDAYLLDDPGVREALAELQGLMDSAADCVLTGGDFKQELETAALNARRAIELFERRVLAN